MTLVEASSSSAGEEQVLYVAQDLLDDGQGGDRALREWAAGVLRAYVAAGYHEGAIVDRIPKLLEVFVEHLWYVQKSLQGTSANLAFTAAERDGDRFCAEVAGRMIERICARA
ncbi:MAG TPA: hypothetical protein VNN19_01845 [bacterium]|nr:hypothetical protein [bacterium]